jgi:hypothetical protein
MRRVGRHSGQRRECLQEEVTRLVAHGNTSFQILIAAEACVSSRLASRMRPRLSRCRIASGGVALGASETFAGLFVSFGCLTITWLCVAVGLRRAA